MLFRSDPVSLRQVTNLAWYSGEEARKYLRRFPTAGLDAFIVVRAMTQEIARGERGLSVTKSIAGRNEGLLETANYVIDVIDCHQWKIIARVHSRLQFRVGGYPSFPIRIASRGVSVSEKSAMNEAEREKLHSDFTKLISSSLIATLRDTNLGIDLPPIGSREIISTPDDEDLYGNIKSVAVASAIGDRLAFIREEPVLAESNPPLEISEWKFDDQIEQMTRGELSKRFTIKNISINRDALMASQIADDAGNYTPAFSGLQTTSDVDAYVVIIKHPPSFAAYDGRVVGNEPGSRGIGLWRTKVLGYDAHINAYLSYAVAVIDARTLKIIRWSESTASPKYAQALPLQEVDSKLWTTNSATLTTDQREVIRQNLVTLINDSIPETLLHLRLGGMMVTDTPILSK